MRFLRAMALDRVSQVRPQIEAKGCVPFVHLGSPQRAKPYFDYYNLSDVERISDPEATLIRFPLLVRHAPTLICTR